MAAVFLLAKKYGAAVVALTLDEGGIPSHRRRAHRHRRKKCWPPPKPMVYLEQDLIVDALAMTVSTGPDNAAVALETLDYVRHRLGMQTVLGVSNISFGLPRREKNHRSIFHAGHGPGPVRRHRQSRRGRHYGRLSFLLCPDGF